MPDGPRGTGAGWRPEIAAVLESADELGFVEVIAESVRPDDPPAPLLAHARRGAVVPHGVRLSLGGTDPVDAGRVSHLAACAEALDAPLVSEHVSFVRAGGREAGHLLPLPRTRKALDVLAANIARVRSEVDVPLAVEPIAALFDWPEDEFDEAGFLTRLLDRTGALLLLDVANVYANARNRGRDPRAVLDALPLDRVAYCHVAGGAEHDGFYHDTHTDPMPSDVLRLLGHVVERRPGLPVMLERDGRHPTAAETRAELAAIARVAGHAGPSDRTPPGLAAPDPERTPAPAAALPAGVPHPSRPVRHAGKGCASDGTAPAPDHDGTVPGRNRQAARQARLVDALVAGGPDPDGFAARPLGATRRALLRKRAGLAAKDWPRLAASLGDGWTDAFVQRFTGVPPTDGLREGWDLAREVRGRGGLPPGAAAELAEREARWRYDGVATPTRRHRLATALRRTMTRS